MQKICVRAIDKYKECLEENKHRLYRHYENACMLLEK